MFSVIVITNFFERGLTVKKKGLSPHHLFNIDDTRRKMVIEFHIGDCFLDIESA